MGAGKRGSGRAGACAGVLWSALALATLGRMAGVIAGWPSDAVIGASFFWGRLLGWLLAAMLLWWLQSGRKISLLTAATGR